MVHTTIASDYSNNNKYNPNNEYTYGHNVPIIDESKRLLEEFENLRNTSNLEIKKARDSLNSSLLRLENRKLK
jgi:hypothetical protein